MTNNSDKIINQSQLKKSLSPIMLWGLGVGYVISGMYFGWNLGLEKGGTLGMGIATLFIIILYITFTFSYAELASAIPKAGGGFDYANKALGKDWGFIAGMAQNIEFIFAPPAIAFAIGAYFNLFFPQLPILYIAIFSYFVFTMLNIWGVKAAATFELIITIFAVFELLLFASIGFTHFEFKNLQLHALPNGISGIFAALPFAIWFFLGIEGVANVAEETIQPQRTILIGFGSAILTLILLCILTFTSAVGVAGWEAIVYKTEGTSSDSPLPLALARIVGNNNYLYHLLITIGLLGLIASFHGLMLAAGRSTYEFGKVIFKDALIGKIHPKYNTPSYGLLLNMGIGIVALFSGKTNEIITIAVFGALSLYIISMVSMIQLRRNSPELNRPFKVPFYPAFPIIALIISILSFISMIIFNITLSALFLCIMLFCFLIYKYFTRKKNSTTFV